MSARSDRSRDGLLEGYTMALPTERRFHPSSRVRSQTLPEGRVREPCERLRQPRAVRRLVEEAFLLVSDKLVESVDPRCDNG